MESDVAEKIAGVLEAKLTGKEKAAINARGTDNAQGYETYLRAIALNNSQSDADNARMRDLFRKAVELDPNFARSVGLVGGDRIQPLLLPGRKPGAKRTGAERGRNGIAPGTGLSRCHRFDGFVSTIM